MRYKTSPKYCYLIYNRDGDLIAKGPMEEILNELDVSEFCIRNAYYKKITTKQGYRVDRVLIDYYEQVWDVVDKDDRVIFTGTAPEINVYFGYKHVNAEEIYARKRKLGGKYRIFKHGEYIKPSISKDTEWIAEMLLIKGNTSIDGKILQRTLIELGKLNILVDIEPSVIFKNGYILNRRT